MQIILEHHLPLVQDALLNPFHPDPEYAEYARRVKQRKKGRWVWLAKDTLIWFDAVLEHGYLYVKDRREGYATAEELRNVFPTPPLSNEQLAPFYEYVMCGRFNNDK